MKKFILFFIHFAVFNIGDDVDAAHSAPKLKFNLERAPQYFETFQTKYKKVYVDEQEKAYRFKVFKTNLELINAKNQLNDTAVYNINKFADLTKSEVISKYTGLGSAPSLKNFCKPVVVDGSSAFFQDSFDWRQFNKVTSVKDQGFCGSCWAFSTIASIESQYAIKYNEHLNLSEQQLVDCDKVDMGCAGGLLHTAFEEIMDMGGVELESDYPYRSVQSQCRLDDSKFVVHVNDCYRYILLNEDKIKDLLHEMGPIAVAVDAVDLTDYYGGIINSCKNYGLNHAVLLVGYGIENEVPFWILKNSWGTDYGENGFVRVRRGVNACGLVNELAASAEIK
jgi:C1A family cysteine protease